MPVSSHLHPSLTPFLPLAPRSYKTDHSDINYIVVSNRLRQQTAREGLSAVSCAHVAMIQDAAASKTLEHYLFARVKGGEKEREAEREREQRQLTLTDKTVCCFCQLFFLKIKSLYLIFL